MPVADIYRRQAALLVRIIPFVALERCFALKGGTAINLFLRDMPRLSVDIDLTYLAVTGRATALNEIDAAMRRLANAIRRNIPGAQITLGNLRGERCVIKFMVRAEGVQIKVEVTPVLRGCVYEPAIRPVSPAVEDRFGFAEMMVVSFADLYAGKIVAALDRQHPRDLFDVKDLLANEGITDDLRKAFIVYIVSHNRPMAEVLAPSFRDIGTEFSRGFEGMTEQSVTLDELLQARDELLRALVGDMPAEHRRLLVSVKRGEPEWELLGLPDVHELPAVRWRLENLAKLEGAKRSALLARLRNVLGIRE